VGIKQAKRKSDPSKDMKHDYDVLVSKIPLRLKLEQHDLVDRLRKESARLWNDILDIHWWLWSSYRVWSSESQMKKLFNAKTHKLHSQTIQATIELHQETCDRTREQRVQGNLDWKYPWRYKRFFSVNYKKIALRHLEKTDCIVFSNGRNEESLVIKRPKHIPFTSIHSAEIVWAYNQYWLHLAIEKPKLITVTDSGIAGADPGEIHALTLTDGKEHLILTARELRSLYQLRNKVLAQLSKKISKKRKGSKAFWKLVRRKQNFLAWISKKVDYALHCLSKMAIDWCVKRGIKKLYLGNPDGVQKSSHNKRSRNVNQKLSNWPFGELRRMLEYKAKRHGIILEKINEAYTSGTCPVCGTFTKQHSRNYGCPACKATGHRDVVGASNIRNKGMEGEITAGREMPKYQETKYRRVEVCPHLRQWRSAHDRAA